jgi:hypothetical protein
MHWLLDEPAPPLPMAALCSSCVGPAEENGGGSEPVGAQFVGALRGREQEKERGPRAAKAL